MAFVVIPFSLEPTLVFIVFAIAIAMLTYYLTSGKYGVNTSWIGNVLDSAESTVSLYSMVILSIIFSVVLVFVATKKFTIASAVVTVLIAALVYLLASSARGSGINISVPSVGYPVPPNLGKDGINNYYPNLVDYGRQ